MGSTTDHRFDELYRQHFADVLAYCMRRSPTADGQDAANDVFEIAWRRIDDVPSGDAARPWLFVVAKRVIYRRWRGTHRFRKMVARAAAVAGSSVPGPETVVVQRAEYEAVLKAASRLSLRDREVLKLAAWEGIPHSEIAEVLGCSVAAVDQRLHRAKQRLTKEYDAMHRTAPQPSALGGEGS